MYCWEKRGQMERQKVLAALERILKSEIRISYKENKGEALGLAASKIGGCPSVPVDFVWPRYKGEAFDGVDKERPLSFLAQINLRDVSQYDEEGILPKSGILSFFYEYMTMKWGFSPEDKGSARVYYFPEETVLCRMSLPEDFEVEALVPECRVCFEQNVSLPEYVDYSKWHSQEKTDWEVYDSVREELGYESDGWGDRTKLLGYADVIQNSMEEECEILRRGYGTGSPEEYAKIPSGEREEIRKKSSDWILLFQMGTVSTESFEMMFGDCGHIYYWIRKQDLAARNFDGVWLILQCS